jgi:hypothetical protein
MVKPYYAQVNACFNGNEILLRIEFSAPLTPIHATCNNRRKIHAKTIDEIKALNKNASRRKHF